MVHLPHLVWKLHKGRNLIGSLRLHPQSLKQSLAYSGYLINIYGMNE